MGFPSLEAILEHPDGYGLAALSPLQRIICRVIEGAPLAELAGHDAVKQYVGETAEIPASQPAEVVVMSGIRTGKTMIAAGRAVRMALTCDVRRLVAGEIPRVSLVSLAKDQARVAFSLILGLVRGSSRLGPLLVGEPTADSVSLRHPSGRVVEIKIVAGSKAGGTLVARWSAGCVFDEAPRMAGQDDGVVNLDDARTAVIARLLPGAQILYIGSPWAPRGPVYEMVSRHWRHPSRRLVVIKAPAHEMNPVTWTPRKVAEVRAQSPEAARTDIDAEFLAPSSLMFDPAMLRGLVRAGPVELPPMPGFSYEAAMDPATRSNRWTLVVSTLDEGKRIVCLARDWKPDPGSILSPRQVLSEIAEVLRPYGVDTVLTDQYSADALRELAHAEGIDLFIVARTAALNVDLYTGLQLRAQQGQLELPDHRQLLEDLSGVTRRVTQTGVSIVLRSTADGGHCDYAAAMSLALYREIAEPVDATPRDEEAVIRDRIFSEERRKEGLAAWERDIPGWLA